LPFNHSSGVIAVAAVSADICNARPRERERERGKERERERERESI
jgi:hypothetical protein